MWAYLAIPFMLFRLSKTKPLTQFYLFLVSLATSLLLTNIVFTDKLVAHWSLLNYLHCFVGGIITFLYWRRSYSNDISLEKKLIITYCLVCLFLLLFNSIFVEALITGLVMLLILTIPSFAIVKLFTIKPIMQLGVVSFPFYLLHLPVLNYVNNFKLDLITVFVLGYLGTFAISYLCHKLIEVPILNLVKN